jgi:glucose-1-phosphate thymidylyltransferase
MSGSQEGIMIRSWAGDAPLQCVILCAGRGKRMEPNSSVRPKVLEEVGGRPAIAHVIDYWTRFADEFVFIVGYRKEMVIEYASSLPIKSRFIEQGEPKGIAHAIMQAEGAVSDRFVVALGDCLCKGEFIFPQAMDQGVGVWKTANEKDITQSYSIELDGPFLKRVKEKPSVVENNLCGMGFYFFRKKVFDYIRETPPSALRNEVEITDVIQRMIDSGEEIRPLWFDGEYINITFPDDVERAERLLSS